MSRTFKVSQKIDNSDKVNLYTTDTYTFETGLTILCGCNGSGKSTMIHNIVSKLDEEGISYIKYDNLIDGGDSARQNALHSDDLSLLANLAMSSEGECISLNIGTFAQAIGSRIAHSSGEFWILLDAVDSGMSNDNIDEVMNFLQFVLDQNIDRDVYIVIAANAYELVRHRVCIDVRSGEPITFHDYEDYREYVMQSRKYRDERFR